MHDKMNGEGEYHGPDGRVYIGQWMNGKCHGLGYMKLADGTEKSGTWENNGFIG